MKLNLKLLVLVPATLELLKAENRSIEELASLLDVQKPFNWPPPLNDKNSQKFFMNYILRNENNEQANPVSCHLVFNTGRLCHRLYTGRTRPA